MLSVLFFAPVEIKNNPIEGELRKRLAINQSYYNIRYEFDVSIRKKFCTIFHTYNDRKNEWFKREEWSGKLFDWNLEKNKYIVIKLTIVYTMQLKLEIQMRNMCGQ